MRYCSLFLSDFPGNIGFNVESEESHTKKAQDLHDEGELAWGIGYAERVFM
ncbi:hypothetical protein J2Z65_003893 [Paenibacillus aceris]|uniref:Uncharacterized protein n=1 Tax=Paenibacillus aceris TaxID=869555 RepID=A0ABS4I1R4_9BACL|nr:hypothetical protein [Paenibacillus aceris]